jgi:hypothetical protein
MRALVVYESMFGNTQQIARAVADGLSTGMAVDLVEVGAAPTDIPGDVDLLVVGGPTHAFGMSRPTTRRSAAEQAQGALVSPGIGLREWLAAVRNGSAAAAAFDTQVNKTFLSGSAARAAARRLRGLGFSIATPATGFYVTGVPGPLVEGELDRARQWGNDLAESFAVRTV